MFFRLRKPSMLTEQIRLVLLGGVMAVIQTTSVENMRSRNSGSIWRNLSMGVALPSWAVYLLCWRACDNQARSRPGMLPGNRGLHLIQTALATRPIFGVDLFVVRKAQLERVGHSLFNVKIRRAGIRCRVNGFWLSSSADFER
jgi:hypothetical protein